MFDCPTKQPVAPDVGIPFAVEGDVHKALYSQMAIDDLMKLQKYFKDLIDWKKRGNPIYLVRIHSMYKLQIKNKETSNLETNFSLHPVLYRMLFLFSLQHLAY